jgi:hypothetical protein
VCFVAELRVALRCQSQESLLMAGTVSSITQKRHNGSKVPFDRRGTAYSIHTYSIIVIELINRLYSIVDETCISYFHLFLFLHTSTIDNRHRHQRGTRGWSPTGRGCRHSWLSSGAASAVSTSLLLQDFGGTLVTTVRYSILLYSPCPPGYSYSHPPAVFTYARPPT